MAVVRPSGGGPAGSMTGEAARDFMIGQAGGG